MKKWGSVRIIPGEWETGEIPIYDIDGRIIWGLTARITQSIVRTLTGEKR